MKAGGGAKKKKNSGEVSPYKNGEEFLVLCNIKEFLKIWPGPWPPTNQCSSALVSDNPKEILIDKLL